MIVAAEYSFKRGEEALRSGHEHELATVRKIIKSIDSTTHKVKVSKEKTMPGKKRYKPGSLNDAFKDEFTARGWARRRVRCDYPTRFYINGFAPPPMRKGAFRDMDFVKNNVGVEVQLGKYASWSTTFARK